MISGRIISTEKETVDFATVYLKGTSYGGTTNQEGLYHIKAPAGDYTLVLTTSTATLRISFRVATPTGIEGVGADKVVLTREYYSVDGKRLPAPVPGINLVKVVYDDHSVEVLKVFVNTDLRR